MKKSLAGLLCTIAILNFTELESKAIVGYVNAEYGAGNHLVTPPVWSSGFNFLSEVFPSVPDGTTIAPWDPVTLSHQAASTFSAGSGWSIDFTLPTGIGALLSTPVLFTNTYVGYIDEDWDLEGTLPNTNTVPTDATGYYLLGNRIPVAAADFEAIIGRAPVDGEQIVTLDETFTYNGTVKQWFDESSSPVTPTLDVAEAAFFNLGPVVVPEPTTFTLLGLGSLALVVARRNR